MLLPSDELVPKDEAAAEPESIVEDGAAVLDTSLLDSSVVLAAALLGEELGKLLEVKSTVELIAAEDDETAGINYQILALPHTKFWNKHTL